MARTIRECATIADNVGDKSATARMASDASKLLGHDGCAMPGYAAFGYTE